MLFKIVEAQTIKVKGRVVFADSLDFLPFCYIVLNDTATYTSDLLGNFQIVLDSNARKCNLSFKYIGFEPLQIINIPLSVIDVNLGDISLNSLVCDDECNYVVLRKRWGKWRVDKHATIKNQKECVKLSKKKREVKELKQTIVFNGKTYHPKNRVVDLK